MKLKVNKYLAFIALASLSLISCAVQQQQKPTKVTVVKSSETALETKTPQPIAQPVITNDLKINLPEVKREFRAAWIATVANINWPSKKNLSTEEQKKRSNTIA